MSTSKFVCFLNPHFYAESVSKRSLPQREVEICERFRHAREKLLEVSQEKWAAVIGVERRTLSNYERQITPLPAEIALRACKRWIISEEWLATGNFAALEKSAVQSQGFPRETNFAGLHQFFIRQCVDLLSDPVSRSIPVGSLYSHAYDSVLAKRYEELVSVWFRVPRVRLENEDVLEIGKRLFSVMLERWLKMLRNTAMIQGEDTEICQMDFLDTILKKNAIEFVEFNKSLIAQTQSASPRPPIASPRGAKAK